MTWVFVLDLPGPTPMTPMIPTSACFLAVSIAVCFIFPASWRREAAFARQLKWLISAQLYMVGHMIVNLLFFNFVFFTSLASNLHWLAALALPAIREISRYLLNALCRWIGKTMNGFFYLIKVTKDQQ